MGNGGTTFQIDDSLQSVECGVWSVECGVWSVPRISIIALDLKSTAFQILLQTLLNHLKEIPGVFSSQVNLQVIKKSVSPFNIVNRTRANSPSFQGKKCSWPK